jgi:hypothetical protein
MNVQSVLDRLRQPEYTGDNRCIPCTLVNLAISGIVCVALWLLRWPLAVGFAVIALGSIALRGYLVPGTPTLTKRYFPDRVLALFDKEPAPTIENRTIEMDADTGSDTDTDTETDADTAIETETDAETDAPDDAQSLDTEQILLESGVLEPCEDINDLCLASDFHEDWNDRKDTIIESDAEHEALTEALDHDDSDSEGEIEFKDHGDAFTAHLDGQSVGQWESRAAFVADLAAARELPNWIDWETLDPTEQGTLIRGLRIFIETCPLCDGPVVPSQETVESCCREHTVVAIACESCDARLFETVAEPDMMNA